MIVFAAMRTGILSALALAAGASSAAADLPVAGVSVDGAASPEAATAITDAVMTAAGRKGPPPPTCSTPGCAATVLAGMGAPRGVVVAVAISGEFHDHFVVTATVVDDQGRALRRRTDECGTCTMGEGVAKVRAAVAAAVDAPADDDVAVSIATAPVAAPISIDGAPPVPSPWSGTLPAGPHRITAGSTAKELFVEAGAPATVTIDVAIAVPPRTLMHYAPYAAAGAGALAVIGGAYLLSVDGDPTCAHPSCPELRDTATGGWLLLGTGVVAIGAAGYLYWHQRRSERPVLALVPTTHGATAVAFGRF